MPCRTPPQKPTPIRHLAIEWHPAQLYSDDPREESAQKLSLGLGLTGDDYEALAENTADTLRWIREVTQGWDYMTKALEECDERNNPK